MQRSRDRRGAGRRSAAGVHPEPKGAPRLEMVEKRVAQRTPILIGRIAVSRR